MTVATKPSPEALRKISAAWTQLKEHSAIGPIRTERDCRRMVALLDGVIDQVGSDERYPLAGLAELLADLIERYEESRVRLPDAEPRAVLDFLMKENGLRQAKALAARFSVSPAVFL